MRNLRKIQNQKNVNTIGEPEIPQVVFEELLVNALIHRDYFITAPIRLFVFDNRIEIINPGSLPDHLTIAKIKSGTSIQRNPTLVSFVAKGLLPYRGLGTGVRRALQDWAQIQFIDDKNGCLFTSCIERTSEKKTKNAPVNAPVNVTLSPLQRKILKILKENSSASYDLLVDKLHKTRSTIMRNIQKMKDMEVLRRSGSDKTGHWEILHFLLDKKPKK